MELENSNQTVFKIGDKVKYKKGTTFSYNGDTIYPEEMPNYYIVKNGEVSQVGNTGSLGHDVKVTYEGKTVLLSSGYLELQSKED